MRRIMADRMPEINRYMIASQHNYLAEEYGYLTSS
jgi:hypothetical protein